MTAISKLEERVADLERNISAVGDSFTPRRITTNQLCVSDASGAQTCITKAQLDALLKSQIHVEAASLPTTQDETVSPPSAEADKSAETTDVQPAESAPLADSGADHQATPAGKDADSVSSAEATENIEEPAQAPRSDATPAALGGDQQSDQTGSIPSDTSSNKAKLGPEQTDDAP